MDTQSAIPPLLEILDLQDLGDGQFRSPPIDDGRSRIYGGQTAAQALAAASFTVDGAVCHSLHSRFLRPGKPGRPVEFDVTSLRDARRFAARQVLASQRDELVYQLSASFQVGEGSSPSFSPPAPSVPHPDELPDEETQRARILAEVPPEVAPHIARRWPMEYRFLSDEDALWFDGRVREPQRMLWLRVRDPLPEYPNLHRCALTYLADFPVFQVCFFPLALSPFDPDIQLASLDHNLWFHRSFRADQWLLFASFCTSVSDGRGLAQGNFFQDGQLVASITQETLIHSRDGKF